MNPKKIKSLIRRARRFLTWRVTDQLHASGNMEIVSDPWERTHTIYTPADPSPDNPLRDIEYLHELAHATLCERVHHVFSTHYFEPGTPEDTLRLLTPVCRVASDWFADAWLMSVCPSEERSEIMEHFGIIRALLEQEQALNPEMLYGAALIIAQAVKYCGLKARAYQSGGVLVQAIGALLSVDPAKPSVQNLETLINKLSACLYPIRVKFSVETGTISLITSAVNS